MKRISLGILILLSLASISLGQTPQECKECAADPCGCTLFKCSKKTQFPADTQDLSKGFGGCQRNDGKLTNIDENCKQIGNRGIILGTGYDLTGESAEGLKTLGLDDKLLAKLSPYFVKQEDPVKFLMTNPVEFSLQEIQAFELIKLAAKVNDLQKAYDDNLFNDSKYGELREVKPKFAELSRGTRTVLFSQDRKYGSPANFNQLWNQALRVDFQSIMGQLNKEGQTSDRSLAEGQILKYCMEKCSESKKVNILFVMDASGSIGRDNFKTQTDFVRNLIQNTKVGEDSYQIGLLLFSNNNQLLSDFSADQAALLTALDKIAYRGGGTYTNAALLEAKRLFTVQSSKRPDSLNIMFVLTDGVPTDTIVDSTISSLKALEVQRYAVGIGSGIDQDVLMLISGDNNQDKSRVYQVTDFNKLKSLINSINVAACSTPQEIESDKKTFGTTLDGQGSQYFQLVEKNVSLIIDVNDLAKPSPPLSADCKPLSASDGETVFYLGDVEVYYSFTYDMPNQFINDGAGGQKDGRISLLINNNKSNITYVALKKRCAGKIGLSLKQEKLESEKCEKGCTLCDEQLQCRVCDAGYELVSGKCNQKLLPAVSKKLAEPTDNNDNQPPPTNSENKTETKTEKESEAAKPEQRAEQSETEPESSKGWLIFLIVALSCACCGFWIFFICRRRRDKEEQHRHDNYLLQKDNQTGQTPQ
ncbi:UNKNOWN [Stylonychia lemnae]|uniref:VWFA domain-containing protein n=1 Tax=Stylonychia lemnae TaxID=5949 RepID=A0A078B1P3_STYLE|nr:UNKNOWN [Stylonychia lemnae]|eukprot:CDW87242.1 UNKNOWN [Stylonychia lemnae]